MKTLTVLASIALAMAMFACEAGKADGPEMPEEGDEAGEGGPEVEKASGFFGKTQTTTATKPAALPSSRDSLLTRKTPRADLATKTEMEMKMKAPDSLKKVSTGGSGSAPVATKLPLSDTGQRLCYSDVNSIDCPGPGEAFYGQDSQYGWDTSFEPSARFTRDSSATAEPVVIDHVTGNTWQGCARGLTGAECSVGNVTTSPWSEAAPYCEGLSWGGHSDWRLPDRWELESIVDLGTFDPAIDTTAFPATPTFSTHPSAGFIVATSFW
ncbi:MAG: DUF1566 domain-containing protein, partial [Deltaproteobacteria bacterium]|nr:DUF1566 domain-containing protein [Deltaproteobacteria bacterium]